VENPLTETPAKPGLGPAPAAVRNARNMSPSRAALLETLRAQTGPTTLAALARAAGLHQNTVRDHLDALVDAGLAARSSAPPSGRGRPAWLYQATQADPEAASEYAGLAAALASALHHRSTSPVEDALVAGHTWGHDLARAHQAPSGRSVTSARRGVVELLDDLGFAPEADARATKVRLTRCPLLEAAHRYPDVVCAVHLGLTQGALEEYGADPDQVRLLPFAEPGACLLHLAARTT
jgi:predicted ArsR family transcriptional regulator